MRLALHLLLLAALTLQGCASTAPSGVEPLPLPPPTAGKAGIYFYHGRTILPAREVRFVLNGHDLGGVRPGEWRYFEVAPGRHRYRVNDGFMLRTETDHDFPAGEFQFFEAVVMYGVGQVYWTRRERGIAKAIHNIASGNYTRRVD